MLNGHCKFKRIKSFKLSKRVIFLSGIISTHNKATMATQTKANAKTKSKKVKSNNFIYGEFMGIHHQRTRRDRKRGDGHVPEILSLCAFPLHCPHKHTHVRTGMSVCEKLLSVRECVY